MRVLFLLLAMVAGCASTPSVPADPVTDQECVELTPELLASRAAHKKVVDKLSEFMKTELEELMAYMVTMTGDFTDIRMKESSFIHDDELAIVYAAGYIKEEHIVDLYLVVAIPPDGEMETIGLFVREPEELKELRGELNKLLNELTEEQNNGREF